MGKKNEQSKYDKLGVMGKREADVRMAGQYGIDVSNYGNTGRPGENYNNKKTYDDLKKDVARAAANDYDVRRSIEAAQLSGNKKAQELGPINSASAAYDAHRFMKKMHGKHVGGGNYDGASDQAGVASHFVNKDREKLMDSMSAKNQEKVAKKAKTDDDEPIVLSEQLQQAEDAVKAFDKKDYDVYNQGKTSDGDDQRQQASNSFLNKFKMNLMSKMQPKLLV
jgi:hypothetical protein